MITEMRGDEHEKAKREVPPNAIPITKLEAAYRQLRSAIILYFSDGDDVAIHTLAYAAHEILRQLAKAKGIAVGLDDEAITMLAKEITAREARAILGLSAGFFKHSGRDAQAVHMFQPDVNEHFLHEAVCLYTELTGEYREEFECFRFAAMLRNPNLVNKSAMQADQYKAWVHTSEIIRTKELSRRDLLPIAQKLACEFIAKRAPLEPSKITDGGEG